MGTATLCPPDFVSLRDPGPLEPGQLRGKLGFGGLIPTTLPGSPRAKSSDDLYVLGHQRPPKGSTLTPSTTRLLHSADLNPRSLTQALTSRPPSEISDVTSGRHASWSSRAVRRATHASPGNPQSPLVLTWSFCRMWAPPSVHMRQASDSRSSLMKPGGGLGLTGWPRVPRIPTRGEVVVYGTLCSGVTGPPFPHWRGPP